MIIIELKAKVFWSFLNQQEFTFTFSLLFKIKDIYIYYPLFISIHACSIIRRLHSFLVNHIMIYVVKLYRRPHHSYFHTDTNTDTDTEILILTPWSSCHSKRGPD